MQRVKSWLRAGLTAVSVISALVGALMLVAGLALVVGVVIIGSVAGVIQMYRTEGPLGIIAYFVIAVAGCEFLRWLMTLEVSPSERT